MTPQELSALRRYYSQSDKARRLDAAADTEEAANHAAEQNHTLLFDGETPSKEQLEGMRPLARKLAGDPIRRRRGESLRVQAEQAWAALEADASAMAAAQMLQGLSSEEKASVWDRLDAEA